MAPQLTQESVCPACHEGAIALIENIGLGHLLVTHKGSAPECITTVEAWNEEGARRQGGMYALVRDAILECRAITITSGAKVETFYPVKLKGNRNGFTVELRPVRSMATARLDVEGGP